MQEGDVTDGTVMAGQIAGLVSKEQSCKEIIEEIISEVKDIAGKTLSKFS